MVKFLETIATGFCFGIGFALALWVLAKLFHIAPI